METYKRHYQPTIVQNHTGSGTTHLIYHFENGYGASVIPEYADSAWEPVSSKHVIPDRFELAVLKYDGLGDIDDDKHWSLCYDTVVTNDTLRWLTQDEVDTALDLIASF